MTDTAPIQLDVRDYIATIRFNRPDVGNALDLAMATALEQALRTVHDDESARVLVLQGNGPLFCAGGDLHAMHQATDRHDYLLRLTAAAHSAVRHVAALQKPVVAAVHGAAAGAGLSFVLLADIVLTTPSAKFTTAYLDVGLTPDCGQSWLLPRVVGLRRALELTLLPRRITADEAVTLGLATTIVNDELFDAAQALARRLSSGPALAYGQARSLLRADHGAELDHQLDNEAQTIARMATTDQSKALIDHYISLPTAGTQPASQ